MISAADLRFVELWTRPEPVPLVPEVRLHCADDPIVLWEGTEEHVGRRGLAPPFWAFAWAGGQALARHVLDHPELVRGRDVLDFAAGSGLVAVAACRAGARSVVAAEIDPLAVAAIRLNALLNDVTLTPTLVDLLQVSGEPPPPADVVLAGDVCYDRAMTARVLPLLLGYHRRGATVLVGDPGRAYLPRRGLEVLDVYDVPVTRSLEDRDMRRTAVSRVLGDALIPDAPPGVSHDATSNV